MSENFFDLMPHEQKDYIEGAEGEIGINATAIEKDIWICWLLAKLFNMDIPMVFKGGTSLSKVYGLIDRFSEDIDITIDRNFLDGEIPVLDDLSKTKKKALREVLEEKLSDLINEVIIPHLCDSVSSDFPRLSHLVKIESVKNNSVTFKYPNVITKNDPYIEERILLEFGGVNAIEPNLSRKVHTLLSEQVTEGLLLPVADICALSVIRTFWEKVTLVHEECHGNKLFANPDRLSRHWYDLVKIYQSDMGGDCLKNIEILKDVVTVKNTFYRRGYSNYEKCLQNNFVLIPNDEGLDNLREDYRAMINAGMFPSAPPNFDELMSIIKKLNEKLNSLQL